VLFRFSKGKDETNFLNNNGFLEKLKIKYFEVKTFVLLKIINFIANLLEMLK